MKRHKDTKSLADLPEISHPKISHQRSFPAALLSPLGAGGVRWHIPTL